MSLNHTHTHHCTENHEHSEYKTKVIVYITAVVMVLEIGFGYYSKSMSLLADGWHMGSHLLCLGLTWLAYFVIRTNKLNKEFKNGTGKVLSLSGFTSAIILLFIALLIAYSSIKNILSPSIIHFQEAFIVAIIGFAANGFSVLFLHHGMENFDQNLRAAYLHILADTLTSFMAIIALVVFYFWHISWLDATCGIFSAIIIGKWAFDLIKHTGKELVDYG